MLTLLAITMFRSYGSQQKIAGNTREKERSFQAAESALQYGEWWLSLGSGGTGVACTTDVTVASTNDMRTCTTALPTIGDPTSWPGSLFYVPPSLKVQAGGGTATDGSGNIDINYSKSPELYITYLGLSPDGRQMLYSVTSAGYGGSTDTTTVVQSTYAVSSKALDLSKP
jgi:type IV pilus assembly protein PilX